MDKKNKGLVDENEHGIILNESGTSVSFGWEAEDDNTNNTTASEQEDEDDATIQPSGKADERLIQDGE